MLQPPGMQTYKELIFRLSTLARDGEGVIEVLERIIKERDVALADAGGGKHAREEAQRLRRMLAAACLSQPDDTLRISNKAIALAAGPMPKLEFKIAEDASNGDSLCRAITR
jgi:hypothetical protein